MLCQLFRLLFGSGNATTRSKARPPQPTPPSRIADDGMDEGDFHSGPAGYSPNTPYSQTQYGSGFDPSADWNDDEH